MSKYIEEFNIALGLYRSGQPRPGYKFGWFSSNRHSNRLYPHIANLLNNLRKAQNSTAQKSKALLIEYFTSPKTKFNNHSFAIYFLEVLCKKYPNEGWENFYPKEKIVKFFNGKLYRGTLQHPDNAFKYGMKGNKSDCIEDYANDTNSYIGVSTSKSKDVAKRYTVSTFNTAKGCQYKRGFLYEINYRGKGGVDIIETLQARNNKITANIASHKEEVNIIGTIDPEDILGYWDQSNEYHRNPKYLEKRYQEDLSFFDRLQTFFNPRGIKEDTIKPSSAPALPKFAPKNVIMRGP